MRQNDRVLILAEAVDLGKQVFTCGQFGFGCHRIFRLLAHSLRFIHITGMKCRAFLPRIILRRPAPPSGLPATVRRAPMLPGRTG